VQRECFSDATSWNCCIPLPPDSIVLTNLEESGSPAVEAAYRSMIKLNKLVVNSDIKF
jgi:hypothetical protein